jgi:hypothetical protein
MPKKAARKGGSRSVKKVKDLSARADTARKVKGGIIVIGGKEAGIIIDFKQPTALPAVQKGG